MTHPLEKQRKFPSFPKLRGRLYIFPALIPMVEIIPWLLTAVGVAASATQLAFWHKHRKTVWALSILCFIVAGGMYEWEEMHRPSEIEGSRPMAEADFPKLEKTSDPAPYVAKKYDSFDQIWSIATKRESLAGPVVAGDLLLIGTFDATLDAHARADGKLAWSFRKHEPIFTNPAPLGKVGFVGEGLHTAPAATLTAFSLPDGKPLWDRQFRSHVEATATLDEAHDRLWTAAGDQSLWSLRMSDGAVLWRQKIGHTDATPLLYDGHLYSSAQHYEAEKDAKPETTFSALDPDNGKIEWQAKLPGNSMGSPQPGPKGVLLVTTAIGQVGPQVDTDQGWSHAVGTDGKVLWTAKLPGLPLPEAAVLNDAGLVIHTLKSGEIIALNTLNGQTAWRVKVSNAFLAQAALLPESDPPLLASITEDGIVSIMNATDGTEIRRFNKKQGGYATPVFDGDVLYITTPHGITAYGGVHLLTRGNK